MSYSHISFSIQDLSTSELIHSITRYDEDLECYELSTYPLEFLVNSSKIEEIVQATEVMKHALDCLYEVAVLDSDTELDEEGEECYKLVKKAGYLHTFQYYNLMLSYDKLKKITQMSNYKTESNEFNLKHINKNRFQIVQKMVSVKTKTSIELFSY